RSHEDDPTDLAARDGLIVLVDDAHLVVGVRNTDRNGTIAQVEAGRDLEARDVSRFGRAETVAELGVRPEEAPGQLEIACVQRVAPEAHPPEATQGARRRGRREGADRRGNERHVGNVVRPYPRGKITRPAR